MGGYTFASSLAAGTGIAATTGLLSGNNFIAGDRGCLPTFAAAAIQTISAPLAIIPGTDAGGALAAGTDYYGIINVLCHSHGICCTTFNCNSSFSLTSNSNLIFLILSIIFAKIFN